MTRPGEVSQMKQRLVYRGIQKWMTGALMFQDEAKAGTSRHPDVRRIREKTIVKYFYCWFGIDFVNY